MAEKRETAVVVSGLTAIVGTLDEKARAFQQIASAASSGLFPAGYDTVPKILAASWFGDGLGVHPTIYMEGIQPVQFGGKTVREPKWEFVNALLRSRLPGFDFTVLEESDTACEIEFFAAGRKSQKSKYTMQEAVKQGLAGPSGRNRDGYEKNARKMLWKQCFKMGADRIGADVLAGLPAMSFDTEDVSVSAPTPAQAIESAIAKATGKPVDVPFEEEAEQVANIGGVLEHIPAEPPAEPESARVRLAGAVKRRYGNLSKAVLSEKVNLLYNVMIEEQTGVNPKQEFTAKRPIGPVEAEQLITYLDETRKKKPNGGNGQAENVEEAPAAEETPEPETNETAGGTTLVESYDNLMGTVLRARKLFGRKFIQEAPPESGKYWFVDQLTFAQAGYKASVKMQVGPDIVAPPELLEQLNCILSEACDAKERNGR